MFSLAKWYLDCTTDQGEAWILYAARLSLGPLHIAYSSVIHAGPQIPVTQIRSLGVHADPVLAGPAGSVHGASIELPALGVSGRWEAMQAARGISAGLYESPEGAVVWNAHLPCARADLTIKGQRITGIGYVELLKMTIPPWKLPINTLRWGRLITDNHHAVWIHWAGPHPRADLWIDGRRHSIIECTDLSMSWSGGRIRLLPRATIRRGALGPGVLDSIPVLRNLVPPRIRAAHEHKWLSQGVLELPGIVESGTSIHETVHLDAFEQLESAMEVHA
ncbi:MAG TPA: hypothetical protein VK176_03845 [Phycisphaerales bacterium]|nr:hypothetical protein [Phycisphaerales bacterium]